jgi:hypothetical protein
MYHFNLLLHHNKLQNYDAIRPCNISLEAPFNEKYSNCICYQIIENICNFASMYNTGKKKTWQTHIIYL